MLDAGCWVLYAHCLPAWRMEIVAFSPAGGGGVAALAVAVVSGYRVFDVILSSPLLRNFIFFLFSPMVQYTLA